jgi:TolB-like protein/DNA-binding winged helix-turn-helix (wHTH) protein/tetratricopeptide (TPR) repeat protein
MPDAGIYRFADVEVDPAAHRVTRQGVDVPLEPKAFAVLVVLLEAAGKALVRDELLDRVWGHRHVTPGVLNRVVAQLRKALGDDAEHPRYIQTLHSLGYRFIAELHDPKVVDGTDASIGQSADGTGSEVADTTGSMLEQPSNFPGLPEPALLRQRRASDTAAASCVDAAIGPLHNERRRSPRPHPRAWSLAALVLIAAAAWWAFERGQIAPRPVDASVAVMPFTTLSDERQDRYFAEGLAAEMHAALAGVHGLKVAAWQSPSAFPQGEDAVALGKRLGVATVLDASVRRAGDRVRISARLADTRSGYTLWSRTYDRSLSDVFATQSDIAHEVATSLVGIMPDAGEGLRRRLQPTRNIAAFDAYLRGVQELVSLGGDGAERALGHFRKALEIDVGFAQAQAGICRVELWRFENNRDASAYERARLACVRAENMDPTMGEVVLALGDLNRVQGELARAEALYRRIENDPAMRAKALVGLARVAARQGRHDDAGRFFREAIASNPSDAHIHADMGYQAYVSGRLQEAIDAYARAVQLEPGNAYLWATYGGLLLTDGSNAAAAKALERSLAIEPLESVLSNLGTLQYQQRDYAAAADYYRRATALNPGHFQIWGNLGDALLADPGTASDARAAFAQAAKLAQDFVDRQPDDARAVAALGWYRAALGDAPAALAAVRLSESIGEERAEVAYYNASTLAVLGRAAEAAQRIATAKAAGLPDQRFASNPTLARIEQAGSRTAQH